MIFVTKSTGEKEPFSEAKVRASIHRIGIPQNQQQMVVAHVKSKLYDGMKTSEIYSHILEFLDKEAPYAKAKFNLKHALMELGPTGYPFEDFIAQVLQTKGYQTTVRQILKGQCITHEIDVVAKKGSERIMVEAKFHNVSGLKTNVHVALYTKARFDDIKEINGLNQGWLVTNTKITSDAVAYADCMGLKVISWNHPIGNSLRDLIEDSGLIPITAITSLSHSQKVQLTEKGIVHCKQIAQNRSVLDALNLDQTKEEEILKEAEFAIKV